MEDWSCCCIRAINLALHLIDIFKIPAGVIPPQRVGELLYWITMVHRLPLSEEDCLGVLNQVCVEIVALCRST